MRNMQQTVHRCAIALSIAHLLLFISFFFPDFWGWQLACQCTLPVSPTSLPAITPGLIITGLTVLALLVLPPLTLWRLVRAPESVLGLVGIWISLFLASLSLGYFGLIGLDAFLFNSCHCLVFYWIPPLALTLSFTVCLVLAITLPLRQRRERIALVRLQRKGFNLEQDESGKGARTVRDEIWRKRSGKSLLWLVFALLGLLSHLLIFLSLSYTYIEYYNPYADWPPSQTTGWQLLFQSFLPPPHPISIMPLPSLTLVLLWISALFVPACIYLLCLLLFLLKSKLNTLLLTGIYTAYLLTMLGLILSNFGLVLSVLSHGGDLSDPYQNTDGAFGIPPLAFLFSLICCGMLFRLLMPQPSEQHFD